MEENLPPGFRFHPTDEELITHYLCRKVSDVGFTAKAIVDVDLNKCEPWDLPGKASMGEKEWYFFSLKDRKYPTGLRTNRATEAGYWKTTGKDKEIYRMGIQVGMKKTLVFYKGRAPKGHKTNWVMHEYRLHNHYPSKLSKEEWVVSRVFKKSETAKKTQEQAQSTQQRYIDESPNSMVNEYGDIELPNLKSSSSSGEFNNGIDISGLSNGMSMASHSTTLPSLSTWATDNLIASTTSLSPINSLLLKAFQFRTLFNLQKDSVSSTMCPSSVLQQGGLYNNGMIGLSSNLQEASTSQPQSQQNELSEQPFNMDSIW